MAQALITFPGPESAGPRVSLSESDLPLSDTQTPSVASGAYGTFDEEGNYTPREIVSDDLGMSFADAISGTMVDVQDGQLVHGTTAYGAKL